MAEHLSHLVLDELAAGLEAPAGSKEHLSSCAQCVHALEAIREPRDAFLASPQARTSFARLAAATSSAPARRSAWWARWALALAVPATAVLVFLALPQEPGERLKGSASIQLLGPDQQPVRQARAKDAVRLALGGGGFSYCAVLSVDERGRVEPLWPPGGRESARIPPGARTVLEPPFEVTPGSLVLFAFFSDRPLELGQLGSALRAQAAGSARPLELKPPAGLAPAVARASLEVFP